MCKLDPRGAADACASVRPPVRIEQAFRQAYGISAIGQVEEAGELAGFHQFVVILSYAPRGHVRAVTVSENLDAIVDSLIRT